MGEASREGDLWWTSRRIFNSERSISLCGS